MFMRYKPYPLDYIMDVDDFMIYCVYGLFGCVFVNATEGRTIRIYIFVHESIIIWHLFKKFLFS